VTRIIAAMLLAASLAFSPVDDLSRIAAWLPGTYDTFAQAAADDSSAAKYRHVRAVLVITPVSLDGIPRDARAFYLEQSLAGQEGAPYRQRVIVLIRRDGATINELYRLVNPRPLVGFDGRRPLAMQDLQREPGCDARWERASELAFRGEAGAAGHCPSSLSGATHVISKFELTPDAFTTLDQGLDESGAVRWGPPAGVRGHIFVKRRR
jgi:hypothetical protein